jgi:hypothetical protein
MTESLKGIRMADEVDRAQEQTEAYIDRARRNAAKQLLLAAHGYCYNCGEALNNGMQLFCDADCRQDYEIRQRQSRIRGAA